MVKERVLNKDSIVIDEFNGVYYTNFSRYNDYLIECDEVDMLNDEVNTTMKTTKAELASMSLTRRTKIKMYWEVEA